MKNKILNNLTDNLVEMIWDLKINSELRSKLFFSASCSSGLTGQCDPLEAGLVVLSAAVEDVVSITGCQVGSLPDLSLQTALVCALHFIFEHILVTFLVRMVVGQVFGQSIFGVSVPNVVLMALCFFLFSIADFFRSSLTFSNLLINLTGWKRQRLRFLAIIFVLSNQERFS